jgi:hypothetical protein
VVVLQYADAAAAQEDLLASCICRALLGAKEGAVCTLQLLRMVLRHLSAAGASPLCNRVCQVSDALGHLHICLPPMKAPLHACTRRLPYSADIRLFACMPG